MACGVRFPTFGPPARVRGFVACAACHQTYQRELGAELGLLFFSIGVAAQSFYAIAAAGFGVALGWMVLRGRYVAVDAERVVGPILFP